MHDAPLITCVIPTYRRPRMVARAIRSVLNQTFTRVCVFVSDNASDDETSEVVGAIASSDPRVIFHCQSENIGMLGNIAYCMDHVETPFYSLLNDDDILLPEFYEVAYSEIQKYPQAILAATNVLNVTEDGRLQEEHLSLWDRAGLFDPPYGAHRVVGIAHAEIQGILWRSEFLQTPYSHIDPHIHAWDYEAILNAAMNYSIVIVDRPGAIMVNHRGSRAKSADPFSVVAHRLDLIDRIDHDDRFPRQVKSANRKKIETYLSGYLRGLSIEFVLEGDHVAANKALQFRSETIGCKDRWNNLIRLVNQLCQYIPPLRFLFRAMYTPVTGIRNRWQDWKLPFIESRYRELLKLE